MTKIRRWYDQDPVLKEAMEVLSLSSEDFRGFADNFIIELQQEMAAEVIERVYQTIKDYQGKGSRWYDNDPVMVRAVELLREAPPHVQRVAAKKLLKVLIRDEKDDAFTFLENEK